MNGGMLVAGPILMMLALIFSGIGIAIGGPILIEGYEDVRTADNIGQYTSADTVVEASPTLFLLGFVISGAIMGMLGITITGIGAYGMYKRARG